MRRSFRRFATTAQHPADRRAQFLVLAVDAAKPTTRPPLPLQQLGLQSLDVLAPRFCLLWPEHPAEPFIAGKRCEVFPRRENLWVGNQDASQIHRDCMYDSAGDRPGAHRSPIVAPMRSKVALRSAAAPGARLTPRTATTWSAASVSTRASGAWPLSADPRGSSWPWPSESTHDTLPVGAGPPSGSQESTNSAAGCIAVRPRSAGL